MVVHSCVCFLQAKKDPSESPVRKPKRRSVSRSVSPPRTKSIDDDRKMQVDVSVFAKK